MRLSRVLALEGLKSGTGEARSRGNNKRRNTRKGRRWAVDDSNGPQGRELEHTTEQQNSNLRRLIETIGNLISASRELLARLQLGSAPPPSDPTPDTAEEAPAEGESPRDPDERGA